MTATTDGSALAATIGNKQAETGRASAFDLMKSMRHEFEKALPTHVPVEQFMRTGLTELRQNPELQRCSADSLLGAFLVAARLGLEVGGPMGQFYLTPRSIWNKELNEGKGAKEWQVVPIIGYKGLLELAQRSGRVGAVGAELVREGDSFRRGYDSRLGGKFTQWEPVDYLETREIIGVLAWAEVGGGVQDRYLPIEKVLERKARGSAGEKGPWATDYDAMVRKTGFRALSGDLPQSAALALARTVDEEVQRYIPGEALDLGEQSE
ncbi:recombinase RecT [Paenarthrobacter sp. NPDC089714]|uniref:recombinase RecT n=1 Tax=Paenarthrobacter sp. NPDC089714 TaxID=3364377 RepID=UPI0038176597